MMREQALDERIHTSLKHLMRLKHHAHGFSFLPKQPVKSVLMGRKRSTIRGRGLDFVELRDYRPGDDIRSMDWRVTNRMRKPYVRIYAEEKDRPVMIIVDQRRGMFFGSQWKMKSVIAAELAALTAWKALDDGDRIGFIFLGDENFVECPPTRSRAKIQQYMALLAKFNQRLTATGSGKKQVLSMPELLAKSEKLITHDYLVIVISDFNERQSRVLTSLSKITEHNDIIVYYVADSLEHDIAKLQDMVVGDGEFQMQIDATNQALVDDYNAYTRAAIKAISQTFAKHNIPMLSFNTHDDVAKQIRQYLGAA
ncbi:DUF58 domain-containing protein [Thalassotalea sp. LPB0316]|uniref:DUF58 domain-containing protein n=1 Tax=Thalassotalea sp. LPB0316 TaxID=2769490 RepID=UPI0018662314|nr:DUF58 domain-containing protein [Thalassotalea sp. LPB0316]QOL25094.1 DUF58 domain-containing protein [Thalassotalea sp. LPB0316]